MNASNPALHPSDVRIGEVTFGNALPLSVIAGPCQMESRDHALETAAALQEIAVKLGIGLVYKSSFDKANRTSLGGKRGVGLAVALPIFAEIRERFGLPVLTDVHETQQCAPLAEAVDVLQIPAFLCRQTDLLLAAAATGRVVNVKKGQFLAPWDMANVVAKLTQSGHSRVLLTERGSSFGYNALVVDMRALPIMARTGAPVIFDATHSVQEPGGLGGSTGGKREFVPVLARAAVAAGVAGVFIETHPDPDNAPSDGPNMIPLSRFEASARRADRFRPACQRLPAADGGNGPWLSMAPGLNPSNCRPGEAVTAAGTRECALAALRTERDGIDILIAALAEELGERLARVVEIFLETRGRVIVTGIGKSGHIGRKVAATFASTGTASMYLHPAEASHGDLGMVTRDDVVLALSWSGETVELRDIIHYCGRYRIPLIAMTASEASALAQAAAVALILPKAAEACPHNLAPTTSTLMQLALGDAIAVALLQRRGFTPSHFQRLHPGGKAWRSASECPQRHAHRRPAAGAGRRRHAGGAADHVGRAPGLCAGDGRERAPRRPSHRRRPAPRDGPRPVPPPAGGDHDAVRRRRSGPTCWPAPHSS